jgi:transposase
MDTASRLPDDPAECRRFLEDLLRSHDVLRQQAQDEHRRAEAERRKAEAERQRAEDVGRRIGELERILEATAADYDRLKEEHAEALETLALLRRYLFGPRRERCSDDPDQGRLFDLPAEPEPLALTSGDGTTAPRPRPARAPRRARFEHLPHIRIEHDLTEAEKTCSGCGAPKARIGEDESRELEFIPARLEVRVHILPKYACSRCRDGVASPPAPPKPTPGGMAGPGLVAFVVVSKFADHLPLYRLEDILTRHGIYLSRSTLGDWVRDAAAVLEPLAALQRDLVLQSPVIWTDDTPVTVLGGEQPGSSTGRFWAYIGDDGHPYTAYDFTMSRSRDGPAAFLSDYRGFLQADAYGGYDGIFLGSDGGVEEVACWAHARRKFFDARSNAPRQANEVLEWVRQLCDIEDRAREWSTAERQALRQREAVPILDRIEAKLDELTGRVLPKSALGKAVTYARNQWAALRRYTSDGRLTIDNVIASYCTSCTGFRFSLLAARRPSLLHVPAEHIVARILIQPMLPVTTDRTDQAGAA